MSNATAFDHLAYAQGQMAIFQRFLADEAHTSASAQEIFALKSIGRLWSQFREDRPFLNSNPKLLSVENVVTGGAFLAALQHVVSKANEPLFAPFAKQLKILRLTIQPPDPALSSEAETLTITAIERINEVMANIGAIAHGTAFDRLLHHASIAADATIGESYDDESCWAYNLVLGVLPSLLGLNAGPLPFPSPYRRQCFRVDITQSERRRAILSQLEDATSCQISDLHNAFKLSNAFLIAFPDRRSTSRLEGAWVLLAGMGAINVQQLSRALSCSEVSARQMLKVLQRHGFSAPQSPYYRCAKTYRFRDTAASTFAALM